MANVISQEVQKGGLNVLSGLPLATFKPELLAQVPIMATGLLAGCEQEIGWDAYGNPYIITESDERVALAAVIVCEDKIFVYNRDGSEQNLNERLDVIGAVGFGLSSGPFKWPAEMNMAKVKSVSFTDYMAVENTDGNRDKNTVKMPIVIVNLESIEGFEEHFIDVPQIDNGMTAKLQAAIMALQEK